MTVDLDVSEWEELNADILYFAMKEVPKECKKFMRREGGRLRTASRKQARITVKKKTGNYFKGIKSSRAWQNSSGGFGVKVYASAPHSHLIESGHEIVIHGRNTGKRTRAFHIMRDANAAFQARFFADAETFADELARNGFKRK